ncbi:hypothetical protein L2E82_48164 [Cichorium intybus]|uniref:Uncharacterized protein n=1 Tax=Cichorium intybus TaxID=13427 RepID=A0ACB8YYZ8_CICIN|nr:hypothetical protein L2E82_48164 [Cichorium intybus]
MSSSKDASWHCDDKDCYICSDINPFPDVCPGQPGYSMNDPLPDKMPDYIFDAMTRAEEENKIDLEKTRILDDRIEVLCEKLKEKKIWVKDTSMKLKNAKRWIEETEQQVSKLVEEKNRIADVSRIRGDFIDREKTMYPLQFPNLWPSI